MIEFRVLGPLEVVRHGRVVEIGAGKRRALLAVLLLHANEVVSSDRLAEEIWGESPPATAPKIVQGYVSQLRKALGGGGRESELLRTVQPGYVLQVKADQLDSSRCAALVGRGRAALSSGAADEASRMLREALALWRGPPLADFAYEPFARDEIARLDELRLGAVEERIDADLALGREADLVGELETLVAREPERERLRGQLMLALYRSGRQSDALQVYREARCELLDRLGLEPGRSLQELEQAILRQDPALDLEPRPAAPPAEPTQLEPAQRPNSVFVGRERELSVLLGALDDALGGRGRVVLVGGEPGIGKSRLAEELARRARARAHVLSGRCWEAAGAPPYWPWAQALRAYIRDRDPELLAGELGPGAAEIADLVPDLREHFPDLRPRSEQGDPRQARFRLFDSVASFLQRASRNRPLVLVVDDLNWADRDSLLLLEFVARELADARVLVIGTYRDVDLPRGHPLVQTLGELARERRVERLPLSGLSPGDVGRFVEAACAVAPEGELVEALYEHTEGNPFFVGEVVQVLVNEGALQQGTQGAGRHWRARIPDGVREAVGRRLDRLSAPCNETLTLAAVIGREFQLAQLAALADELTEDQLLDVLEEALTARIVEEPSGVAGRYQFTHALIQATILDALSQTRRARLHARVAQSLEAVYGAQAEAHAAELAHHFGEAEAVLGSEKLIRYSLLAGESALAAQAPEQALAHFQRALAAKGDGAMDDETAELAFGIGRAQLAVLPTHELNSAIENLRRAFEYHVAAGDVDRAVAVASHPLPLSLRFGYTDAAQMIARASTLVSPDAHAAGRLLAQHAWFTGFIEADYEGAQRAFHQALAIAEREHDAALERMTLAYGSFVDAFHLRWEDCLAKGLRALDVRLDESDRETWTELAARRPVAFALCARGEGAEARRHTTAAVGRARELRESWWLTSTSFSHELMCLYDGDWSAAREMSELGLAAAAGDPRHLANRAVLEYVLGNAEDGAAHLARLEAVARSVPPPGPIADHVFAALTAPLVARTARAPERLEAAVAFGEGVLALPRLAPVLRVYATSGLALAAVLRRNAAEARRLHDALAQWRGTASFFLPLALDGLLGLLAATYGDLEAAAGHLDDGLAFCRRAGYRPEYARIAIELADVLRKRGRDDDARAAELAAEALAIAQELGMAPLAERVLSLQPD